MPLSLMPLIPGTLCKKRAVRVLPATLGAILPALALCCVEAIDGGAKAGLYCPAVDLIDPLLGDLRNSLLLGEVCSTGTFFLALLLAVSWSTEDR